MRYYREPNGDYLAIEPSTRLYYREMGRDEYEGRAAAIEGTVSSVCTTGVGMEFLQRCTRVLRPQVPRPWLRAIMGKWAVLLPGCWTVIETLTGRVCTHCQGVILCLGGG